MTEILGALLFVSLAVLWIVSAGSATKTVAPSVASLLIYLSLNFGLYWRFGLVEDEATHYWFGVNLASALVADSVGAASGFPSGKEAYVWLLAILMLFFGQSPLPALALSALFMVALPAIFTWTGRNLGLFVSGSMTAWLAVLAPPFLLWGHGLNREPLVFLLLACLLLSFSWLARGRWLWAVTGVVAVGLILSSTRSSLLAVVGAGFLAFAVLRLADVRRESRRPGLPVSSRGFLMLSLVPIALFFPGVWLVQRVLDSSQWQNFGAGIPELSDASQATAVVDASWDYNSSIGGFLYNVIRALFGPMPWEVTTTSLLFFAVEASGYFWLAVVVLCGALSDSRTREVGVALVATAIPLVVAASLLMANYGLNSRIRAHVFVILLLVVEPTVTRLWSTFRKPRFEDSGGDAPLHLRVVNDSPHDLRRNTRPFEWLGPVGWRKS